MRFKLTSLFMLSLGLLLSVSSVGLAVQDTPRENDIVRALDWSSDGSRLAILSDAFYIYDRNFQLITTRPIDKPASYISLSPDGTLLAVQNEIWMTDTLEPLFQLDTAYILGDWNADGSLISGVARGANGINIYDTHNGKLLKTIAIDDIQLGFNPLWSPDGEYFAAANKQTTVVIIDANNIQSPKRYPQQDLTSPAIAWSHDGTRIAFTGWAIVPKNTPGSQVVPAGYSARASVHIMDVLTGNLLTTFMVPFEGANTLLWSPNDQELLAVVGVTNIFIWDTQLETLTTNYQSNERIVGVNYSPFGGQVLMGLYLPFVAPTNGSNVLPKPMVTNYFLDGSIRIIVPAPSPEKLQSILELCEVEADIYETLTAQIEVGDLEGFIADVSALTAVQMPIGCQADLLAVARALVAEIEGSH